MYESYRKEKKFIEKMCAGYFNLFMDVSMFVLKCRDIAEFWPA